MILYRFTACCDMCIAWLWQWIWESKTTTCKCNRLHVRKCNVDLHAFVLLWSHFAPFMYLFCCYHFICLFVGLIVVLHFLRLSSSQLSMLELHTSNSTLKMHKPVRSTVDFPIQMVYTLNFALTFLASFKPFLLLAACFAFDKVAHFWC